MAEYEYTIAIDITAQALDPSTMHAEMAADTLAGKYHGLQYEPGALTFKILTNADLTTQEETDAAAIVLAHSGTPNLGMYLHAASQLIEDEKAIVSDVSWQELGGVVTNASFFVPDLTKVVGRVTGVVKTDGATAELKILQDDGTPKDLNSNAFVLPDTSNTWQIFQFTTDISPDAGEARFCIMGRLNGTTTAEIKQVSMSLLETYEL